ncbi:MAG: hypothetical protein M3R04_02315 [bacterium]|nr:hypothetical protein [bacterium]
MNGIIRTLLALALVSSLFVSGCCCAGGSDSDNNGDTQLVDPNDGQEP